MYYDYVEFCDGTQIAYSEVLEDDTVDVSVERPIELGFNSARCSIPSFEWSGIEGFSKDEITQLDEFVHKNAPLILRLAREVSKTYA